jgi:gluconolactonase
VINQLVSGLYATLRFIPPRLLLASVVCLLVAGSKVAAETPVQRDASLELVRSEFGLADGPCWDGSGLVVPDVKGDRVYRYQPKTNQWKTLIEGSGRVSASYFNHGRVYLSDNGEQSLAFADGASKHLIVSFQSGADSDSSTVTRSGNGNSYRPNDLVVDCDGGVYITMTARGEVLYVNAQGEVTVAADQIETPNGIILSPDEKTLYVASFVPKKILAYDIKTQGQATNERFFAKMDDGPERGADGMSVDRAGNVYCAGPDAVWIWNPKGDLIDKIQCPSKPINCVFGDADMRSLYITCMEGLYRQPMKISGCSPRPVNLNLKPSANVSRSSPEFAASTEVPDSMKTEWNVVYSTRGSRSLLADLFYPASAPDQGLRPALIVVHGGGWHSGDKTKFQALSIKLAAKGYLVASIEYRLADEAAFPAAIHDCFAAVRYLRANADRLKIDPSRIGAIGGSAGGHLVGLMASGSQNEFLLGSEESSTLSSGVQGAVVMAGPMEMLTGSVADRSRNQPEQSNANRWLRATVDEAPDLYAHSDAYHQIDRKTSPILFLVGEHDLPSRNQPSRDKLGQLGIATGVRVFSDGKHGCWNRLPWMDQMVEEMDLFLTEQLR